MTDLKYSVSTMRIFFSTGQYNKLLSVPMGATQEEIERAFKNQAKIFHPDKKDPRITQQEANEVFGMLNIAKQRLIESHSRIILPSEKIEKSEYAIKYLIAKNASVKQQLHRILQNDLQRILELQMDLERREAMFGRLEKGLYKVWVWVSGKNSHRRLILLSAALLSSILAGGYIWSRKREAFVRVAPAGYLTYTKSRRRG
jgi:hypothetical protein